MRRGGFTAAPLSLSGATVLRLSWKAERKTEMEKRSIQEARKAFKAIGYKVSIKTYSDFCAATVKAPNGDQINGGLYFTPEGLAQFKAGHAPALAILDSFKGRTFDGAFRVVF
jgi:hypothetical protein